MKKFFFSTCLLLLPQIAFSSEGSEVQELKQKVIAQESIIQNQQKTIDNLLQRMTELENKVGASAPSPQPAAATSRAVNLEEGELPSISSDQTTGNVLEQPWYKNIHIDGFGAAGFLMTGGRSIRENGSFLNYEATLNVDAKVWDDIHYFQEIKTVPLGDTSTTSIETAKVYLQFNDVMKTFLGKEGGNIGAKIGRIDIPFGEEYLTQDVFENPLITVSAPWPWGWDEGIVVYGGDKLHWIAALTDGDIDRSIDSTSDKAVTLKLYGNVTDRLYLSGSVMRDGQQDISAIWLGDSLLAPVGSFGSSSLGTSPSTEVNAYLAEGDARYDFGDDRYIKGQLGYVFIDDKEKVFDRDIYYFQFEPKWNLGSRFANKWAVVGRVSAIGTFNNDKGYYFTSRFDTGGNDFGFDSKSMYRYSLGLDYRLNPRTIIKFEYSMDDFHLIHDSTKIHAGNKDRDLIGIIAAVKF